MRAKIEGGIGMNRMSLNALYDIHEYADLIRGIMQALDVQSETLRYVSQLSELILKRVDFISGQLRDE